jgi:hypothetical protein
MLQKVVLAGFALAVCVGLGLADEFRATITKVDGDKVTFNASTKDKKEEDKTLPVSDKVKIVNGKYNEETKKVEAGDPIEGGLKASVFTSIGDKGVRATIVTDSDNKKITEIRVGGKKK